jgi:hypothetical protein
MDSARTYLKDDEIRHLGELLLAAPNGLSLAEVLRINPRYRTARLVLEDLAQLGGVKRIEPEYNPAQFKGRIPVRYMATARLDDAIVQLLKPETRIGLAEQYRITAPKLTIQDMGKAGCTVKLSLNHETVSKLFHVQNETGNNILSIIDLAINQALAGVVVTTYNVRPKGGLLLIGADGKNCRGEMAHFLCGFECDLYPGKIIGSEMFADIDERNDARKRMAIGETRELIVYHLDVCPLFDEANRLILPLTEGQMSKRVRAKVAKVSHPK